MYKGIITKHSEMCAICGRPKECTHHLLFGKGIKNLAEEDGVHIPMCNRCHNMGAERERIHDNEMAERLSKIVGQLGWEKHKVASGMTEDEAREAFRKRYGRSYL